MGMIHRIEDGLKGGDKKKGKSLVRLTKTVDPVPNHQGRDYQDYQDYQHIIKW